MPPSVIASRTPCEAVTRNSQIEPEPPAGAARDQQRSQGGGEHGRKGKRVRQAAMAEHGAERYAGVDAEDVGVRQDGTEGAGPPDTRAPARAAERGAKRQRRHG